MPNETGAAHPPLIHIWVSCFRYGRDPKTVEYRVVSRKEPLEVISKTEKNFIVRRSYNKRVPVDSIGKIEVDNSGLHDIRMGVLLTDEAQVPEMLTTLRTMMDEAIAQVVIDATKMAEAWVNRNKATTDAEKIPVHDRRQ